MLTNDFQSVIKKRVLIPAVAQRFRRFSEIFRLIKPTNQELRQSKLEPSPRLVPLLQCSLLKRSGSPFEVNGALVAQPADGVENPFDIVWIGWFFKHCARGVDQIVQITDRC